MSLKIPKFFLSAENWPLRAWNLALALKLSGRAEYPESALRLRRRPAGLGGRPAPPARPASRDRRRPSDLPAPLPLVPISRRRGFEWTRVETSGGHPESGMSAIRPPSAA